MDNKQKMHLLASATPEARAAYEKLDRAGLLTDEMLAALGELAASVKQLQPETSPKAMSGRDRAIASSAQRHGLSFEETEAAFTAFGG